MERGSLKQKLVETDVLCIGGGIAGLMAAIRKSKLEDKVLTTKRGNVIYIGCGAIAKDYFMCYVPEIHSFNIESSAAKYQ